MKNKKFEEAASVEDYKSDISSPPALVIHPSTVWCSLNKIYKIQWS